MRLFDLTDVLGVVVKSYRPPAVHLNPFFDPDEAAKRKTSRLAEARRITLDAMIADVGVALSDLRTVSNCSKIDAFREGKSGVTVAEVEAEVLRATACHARRASLCAALKERGCTLRDDSRVCDDFVFHGDGTVAGVADAMAEMRFFHERTDYPRIRQRIMDDLCEREREYARDMGIRLRHDDYVELGHAASRDAKVEALRDFRRRTKDDSGIPPSLLK
jgi:hypothetical protein